MIIGTRYIPIKGNMELFNSNAEHVDLNTPRGGNLSKCLIKDYI